MGKEYALGPTSGLPSGKVVGAGPYAVGNSDGQYFAVNRRCRHLGADLAKGSIDAEGCLVTPVGWSVVRKGFSPRCQGLVRHSKRSPGSCRSVEAR